MSTKEDQLKNLNLEIKEHLESFKGLSDSVDVLDAKLDQRISSNVELLLKEIKEISLISVTAAPFSLNILLTEMNISGALLATSFVIFLINVLILNIGLWYVNNEFLRSTSSQILESVSMRMSVNDINNNLLQNDKRVLALFQFFKSKDNLINKKKMEPYKHVRMVDKIRFLGISLLSSAIITLIASIVLPLLN